MTFLVAPSEPKLLRQVGKTAIVAEEYGADILIPGNGYFIGVQRKQFPGDFLNSMRDGRLSTSLIKLTKTEIRILLLEGVPEWNSGGNLIDPKSPGYVHEFSKDQLNGIIMSAHSELGVLTVWTESLSDTINYLEALEKWAAKDKHNSLFTRPGPTKDEGKRRFSDKDRGVHILQGFDGIGPETAGSMYDHWGGTGLKWKVDAAEMMEVEGIGKVRAERLQEAL